MGKVLGIDLGTTNSAMAFMDGTDPKIIEPRTAFCLRLRPKMPPRHK